MSLPNDTSLTRLEVALNSYIYIYIYIYICVCVYNVYNMVNVYVFYSIGIHVFNMCIYIYTCRCIH